MRKNTAGAVDDVSSHQTPFARHNNFLCGSGSGVPVYTLLMGVITVPNFSNNRRALSRSTHPRLTADSNRVRCVQTKRVVFDGQRGEWRQSFGTQPRLPFAEESQIEQSFKPR